MSKRQLPMGFMRVPAGSMQNFTYMVWDVNTKDAVIIDPSWDLDILEDAINEDSLCVTHIVNTHGHFDHTTGNEHMAKFTGAPIAQHELSTLRHDISLKDGDKISFGRFSLGVMYTPGHSKDSICLTGPNMIFTGDTLFVGSCGRVDLPGGSARDLYHSLFTVLAKIPDNTIIFPGHDYGTTTESTMGEQRKTNPVLMPASEKNFVARMTG